MNPGKPFLPLAALSLSMSSRQCWLTVLFGAAPAGTWHLGSPSADSWYTVFPLQASSQSPIVYSSGAYASPVDVGSGLATTENEKSQVRKSRGVSAFPRSPLMEMVTVGGDAVCSWMKRRSATGDELRTESWLCSGRQRARVKREGKRERAHLMTL